MIDKKLLKLEEDTECPFRFHTLVWDNTCRECKYNQGVISPSKPGGQITLLCSYVKNLWENEMY